MKKLIIFCGILFFLIAQVTTLYGQIDIKGKLKSQTNARANSYADQGISKGFDAGETGVKKGVKAATNKKDKSVTENGSAATTGEDETGNQAKAEKETAKKQPDQTSQVPQESLQAYSKFDFIPGEKVIFFDDFSQDNTGDFPALWSSNGSAEVVTTNLFPGKWMRFICDEAIWTDKLLTLPDNYTIEFDIIPIEGQEGTMGGYDFRLIQSINPRAYDHGAVPGNAGFLFNCDYSGRTGYRTYINSDEGQGLELTGYKDDEKYYQRENKKYHISIWVQKSRIRLYQDETETIRPAQSIPSYIC